MCGSVLQQNTHTRAKDETTRKKAKKTVQRASSVIFPLTESAYAPGWYLPVVKSANEKEQPTNIVKRKKKDEGLHIMNPEVNSEANAQGKKKQRLVFSDVSTLLSLSILRCLGVNDDEEKSTTR